MKRLLFLSSHVGSGSDQIASSLDATERVQVESRIPDSVHSLANFDAKHKCRNIAGIFCFHLLWNHEINSKNVYSWGDHIFVVRSPETTLSHLANMGWGEDRCRSYLAMRYDRLYSMASRCRRAIFIDPEKISNENNLISKFIGISDLSLSDFYLESGKIDPDEDCLRSYDRCVRSMKKFRA